MSYENEDYDEFEGEYTPGKVLNILMTQCDMDIHEACRTTEEFHNFIKKCELKKG